jgi:hypothetical protein
MVVPLPIGTAPTAGDDALDKNLSPGETVEVIVTGPSNQAIVCTRRRVPDHEGGDPAADMAHRRSASSS